MTPYNTSNATVISSLLFKSKIKYKFYKHIVLAFILVCFLATDAIAQDPGAVKEIDQTDSGIVVQRLTEIQKTALINPSEGLVIFQTTEPKGFHYFNGLDWKLVGEENRIEDQMAKEREDANDQDMSGPSQSDKNQDEFNVHNTTDALGRGRMPAEPHQLSVLSSIKQLELKSTGTTSGTTSGITLATSLPSDWSVQLRTQQDMDWLQLTNSIGTIEHSWNIGRYYPNSTSNAGNNSGYISGNGTNISIGIDQPLEKLHVNGAIKVGNTVTNNGGTIKFTGSDLLGYNGTDWKSLTNLTPWVDADSGMQTSDINARIRHNGGVGIGDMPLPGIWPFSVRNRDQVATLFGGTVQIINAGDFTLNPNCDLIEGAAFSILTGMNIDTDNFDGTFAIGDTLTQQSGITMGVGIDGGAGGVMRKVEGISLKLDLDGTGTIMDYKGISHFFQGSNVSLTEGYFLADQSNLPSHLHSLRLDPIDWVNLDKPTATLDITPLASTNGLRLRGLVTNNVLTNVLVADGNGVVRKRALSSMADADANPTNEIQDLSLMGNNLKITNNPAATNIDLSTYLDNVDNQDLTNVLTAGNDAGALKITNLADPVMDQDAATKASVDASIAAVTPIVQINGADPGLLGLKYVGPSSAGSQAMNADQFVSDEGYYINIYKFDSLAHETIYFTDNNMCSGAAYVEGGSLGRGGVFAGDNALFYVPKANPVVPEITYLSSLVFNLGTPPVCSTVSSTAKLVFQVLPNAPITTGISLSPTTAYSVTFGM